MTFFFQKRIKADRTGSEREKSFVSTEETESIDDESLQDAQNPGFLENLRGKFQSDGGPCFPYWCVYVGWVLCILTVSLSCVFTLFYSMMWGKEKSNMWLTTMAISFIQDTLISQPLKVVIVALIFAVFFKSADDEDYFEESQSAQGLQNFNIKRLTTFTSTGLLLLSKLWRIFPNKENKLPP